MSRFPLVAVVLAAVAACALSGCDSGGSSHADKPHRSTTTSSSVTTSTTVPTDATTTTIVLGTTTTTAPPNGTCGAQTSAILAAIGDGPSGLKENAGKYTVAHCRLAASSPIYAAASIVPNPGVQLDGATVVLERIGALWNVDSVGTSQVGCSLPAQIISDLGLSC